MRLTELGLDRFRNLRSMSLEIHPAGAVLVGSNGQGKTNFLEAVHYLALFRSFRGASHREVIAFGEERFGVRGEVVYSDGRTRRMTVSADRSSRDVALDGHAPVDPAEAVGTVSAVAIAPADLAIVAGAPAERRRYLDAILARMAGPHWRTLRDYGRVLRQRNEALRRMAREAELEVWDESLVAVGTPLVVARAALVRRLDALVVDLGSRIAPDLGSELGLRYRPSVPVNAAEAGDLERVGAAWRTALHRNRDLDRRRGWTAVGPQCDELQILVGGRSAARYGSQGQQRTAAIALRLSEADVLEGETGHAPILLLDDVFAEVDEERSRRLLPCFGDERQKFVTSARPLSELDGMLECWQVHAGRIEPRVVAA